MGRLKPKEIEAINSAKVKPVVYPRGYSAYPYIDFYKPVLGLDNSPSAVQVKMWAFSRVRNMVTAKKSIEEIKKSTTLKRLDDVLIAIYLTEPELWDPLRAAELDAQRIDKVREEINKFRKLEGMEPLKGVKR